jgi:hypothetical protein
VSPDTNSLVAAIAALCAAVMACVAVSVVLLVRRSSGGATQARHRLTAAASSVRSDGPRLRAHLATTAHRVGQLQEGWQATDRAVGELTDTLGSVRGSLEGLTKGRLATLIRGAGIVSKVAQLALLWR